ncbi:hypothetical protein DPMN_048735 [Dreissena polymorpha]|uniref:Uncharacterized protein n=1 Tax=Dreissena polymorpha TaxID=45954 RepID=A0A9D4DDP6_DREPO|nr:hypothetical protein DPMN_048603 [Dreissena polymorpha]KAH3742005.1 hypothetical protein DPMN_048735 [Dreissena polymorpha]
MENKTRAPPGDRQTTKTGRVWTRHMARISVQVSAPGHFRGRSQLKPSAEKLDRLCGRVYVPPHG